MGLRLAARFAGSKPKMTPVATLTTKARMMTSGCMTTLSKKEYTDESADDGEDDSFNKKLL